MRETLALAVVLAGCCAALLASSVDVAFAYDCETHDLVQATRMLQTERCNELEVTHSATGAFGVDPAALDDFVEALLGNQYVRKVELSDNGFGDEAVTKVMSALVQRELDLYSLEIVSNGVTDAGIPAIVEFLRKSSALRSLKLARNSITDTGASLIADSLPRQLHELDLSWNDVADTGFLSLLHAAADTMVWFFMQNEKNNGSARRHTHTDTHTDRHTHRHTHTDRHTDRQTDTHTHRHTHTFFCCFQHVVSNYCRCVRLSLTTTPSRIMAQQMLPSCLLR